MLEVKYFFNGVELVDDVTVQCEISHAYGESTEDGYVINKSNKLYFVYKNQWDNALRTLEVNDCDVKIVEVI